jgi:hypothetical protein
LSGRFGKCLAEVGLLAHARQILDVTAVRVPIRRNPREETARVKAGEVPEEWSEAKRAQKEVDARWTKKHGRSFRARVEHVFGYRQDGLGGTLVHTFGLARAAVKIGMTDLTYNFRRYLCLIRPRSGAPAAT